MRLAVVGAGLAGLATAHLALRAHPDLDVVVLESGPEAGGKVRSSRASGFLFDWGPDGFLANVPETIGLVRSLGLEAQLRFADDASARRYLYVDGGLRPVPTSLASFLRSDLLSPAGKLRVLSEPALGGRSRHEESVHAFIARHFGHEAARVFGGVFVAGVSAGDPRDLSLDALFPRLRVLEASHGSLLRGLAAARSVERNGSSEARLTTLAGGMQTLVDALAASLGSHLRTGVRVTSLDDRGRPGGGTIELRTEARDGPGTVEADAVALAVPAYTAAELLSATTPDAAGLGAIRYTDVAVVALGYDRIDVPTVLDGVGLLAPRGEGVRALGVTWSSAIFPEQAPPGKVAVRVFGGGTHDPGYVALDDDALLASVRRDLTRTMGIVAAPETAHVVRWPRGIPQYGLGHLERVERARRAIAARWPRLALVGDYLGGVGINDVVRAAQLAAIQLTGVPRV